MLTQLLEAGVHVFSLDLDVVLLSDPMPYVWSQVRTLTFTRTLTVTRTLTLTRRRALLRPDAAHVVSAVRPDAAERREGRPLAG